MGLRELSGKSAATLSNAGRGRVQQVGWEKGAGAPKPGCPHAGKVPPDSGLSRVLVERRDAFDRRTDRLLRPRAIGVPDCRRPSGRRAVDVVLVLTQRDR